MASTSGNDVARRYATALFELAKEQNALDRISADLQVLGDIIATSADFNRMTANTTLKRDDQTRALLAIAEGAKFSDITHKFLGLVAARRRLPALSAIVAAVQAEIARHKGEVTAEVTAAHALTPAQIDSIASGLKKALGMQVKVRVTEDTHILGGLVVRVGSQLIDSSVRTKLDRLARALKTQDQSTGKTKMKEVA